MSDDEAVPMRAGWPVRALADYPPTVRAGDVGEIRRTALSAWHLIYWERAKATRFLHSDDFERIQP